MLKAVDKPQADGEAQIHRRTAKLEGPGQGGDQILRQSPGRLCVPDGRGERETSCGHPRAQRIRALSRDMRRQFLHQLRQHFVADGVSHDIQSVDTQRDHNHAAFGSQAGDLMLQGGAVRKSALNVAQRHFGDALLTIDNRSRHGVEIGREPTDFVVRRDFDLGPVAVAQGADG